LGADACAGCTAPIVAREGEVCYELAVHNGDIDEDTYFTLPVGESYDQFYYAVPWPANTVATRWGVVLDAPSVVAHVWLFEQAVGLPHGTVERNVLGTTLLQDARLVAPWSIGDCVIEMPQGTGLELPDPSETGTVLMAQWHHANFTDTAQDDSSKLVVCTEPAGTRTAAAFTMLGTESITTPNNTIASHDSVCLNDSGSPISIAAIAPQMRRIGVHMQVVIEHLAGGTTVVHDHPFDYGWFALHSATALMQPGDGIRTECTFDNPYDFTSVGYGQSIVQETCYAFALSYPPRALDNGIGSLIGATNTCWED
jgi:hypothetical protein